jgi:hypothetical protein
MTTFNVNDLVESQLTVHNNSIKNWRVLEVEIGETTGKIRYFCEAATDTKSQHGFDSIKREFSENELELA